MKFVKTGEASFLDEAILELQEVASSKDDGGKEEQYLKSLSCSISCNGNEMKLSLVESAFFLISSWCDIKLQAYHLHFREVNFNSWLTFFLWYPVSPINVMTIAQMFYILHSFFDVRSQYYSTSVNYYF